MFSFLSDFTARLMRVGDVQRQSFLHFGTSVAVMVLGFLSTMAITHLTGSPSVPGGLFLFLSYLGIFSLISSGGLGGAAIAYMSPVKQREEYFSAYLALRILLLVVSLFVLVLFAPLLYDLSVTGLFPWLLGAVAVTSLSDIVGTWVYGTGRAGFLQISTLVNNLIRIIVQTLAVVAGFGVAGLAGGVVAGLVAGLIYLVPLCRFRPVLFNAKAAENLIRFSFWSLLASGGMVLYGNIDTILLGYFASTSEVGLYRIPLQLASFSLFSALALQTILYPKFVAWNNEGRRDLISAYLASALSYSLLLALPVCIGGSYLGGRLLYFLYGSPYEAAWPVLILLLITQVAYVFVYLWSMALGALGIPRAGAMAALIASVVNIPLNLILIPGFGITGAAAAILITVIVHACCAYKFLKPHIRLTPDFRALRSISLATGIMVVCVVCFVALIPPTTVEVVAAAVGVGGGIYLLTLIRLEHGIDSALRRMIQEMGIVLPEWL
ncbi:flippase [Methanospirillum sp.]|uniref:flippase n=1 Tax=Methanospirillum sp. TaxID=45200 RepID=UPI002D7F8CC4|nr:flippase [Methanospirillum sp.]